MSSTGDESNSVPETVQAVGTALTPDPAVEDAKGEPEALPKGYIDIVRPIPLGLDVLVPLKELFFQQRKEDCGGCKTNTRYSVTGPTGKEIYVGVETSSACIRKMCGKMRGLTINLMETKELKDNEEGKAVICIEKGSNCGCSSALKTLEVYSGTGEKFGSVRQRRQGWRVKYDILNETGDLLYIIHSPCCTSRCCGPSKFKIKEPTQTKDNAGLISKHWNGMVKDIFPDEDNLSIYFPDDARVEIKAVLLAASIFIDVTHFKRMRAVGAKN